MKITVFYSGRKNGNGRMLIKRALVNFDKYNPNVKEYNLNEMQIQPCKGCFACRKKELCVCNDEMNQLRKDLISSDFVIFASPIYMLNASGSFCMMINRLYPLLEGEQGHYTKRHKPVKSMLILTQGAPSILFGGVERRIKSVLSSFGFQIIGTVRMGIANELGAVEKNVNVMKKIDRITRKY